MLFFVENVLPHDLHSWFVFCLWTKFTWAFRWIFKSNYLSQNSHENSDSFSLWTDLTWSVRTCFRWKVLSHRLQVCVSIEWVPFSCFARVFFVAKVESHNSHLKVSLTFESIDNLVHVYLWMEKKLKWYRNLNTYLNRHNTKSYVSFRILFYLLPITKSKCEISCCNQQYLKRIKTLINFFNVHFDVF